jgi:hypothetical protein
MTRRLLQPGICGARRRLEPHHPPPLARRLQGCRPHPAARDQPQPSSDANLDAAGKAGRPTTFARCLAALSKAATRPRALLLADGSSHRGGKWLSRAAQQPASYTRLSALPVEVLLHILQLAATPMSAWL